MPEYLLQTEPMGHPILGIIIPAIILVAAFIVTWLLYRHFVKKGESRKQD